MATALNISGGGRNETSSTRDKTSVFVPRMPLTLSSYRGTAVRLTDCDISSCIEDHYEWPVEEVVLGRGATSVVRLCSRKRDGRWFAVKCIDKIHVLRERKQKLIELQLLRTFAHPNIVALLDSYETDTEIQLVMEYCAGGELFDVVEKRRYSERDAAHVTKQVLDALEYLHQRKIIHRDIKPENILLPDANDDTFVKLSDFGVAKILPRETEQKVTISEESNKKDEEYHNLGQMHLRQRAYSSVGSDYYTAPEVETSNRGGYDESVDMYSVGVVLYILLCGFPPFDRVSKKSLTFPDSHWANISEDAKDLIRQLLSINPIARPTAREALKHPWIHERDVNISNAPMSPIHVDAIRKFNSKRRSLSMLPNTSILMKRLHSLSKSSPSVLTKRLHTLEIEDKACIRKAKSPKTDEGHDSAKGRLAESHLKATLSPQCVTPR